VALRSRELDRRRAESVVQLVPSHRHHGAAAALGILRDDLNGDWQRTLPPNLPNYFFINIPRPCAGFRELSLAQGARTTRVLPMIRGRLTGINGHAVDNLRSGRAVIGEDTFAHPRADLTWASSWERTTRQVGAGGRGPISQAAGVAGHL